MPVPSALPEVPDPAMTLRVRRLPRMEVGAAGTQKVVAVADAEGVPSPAVVTGVTVNQYCVPLVKLVTVALVVPSAVVHTGDPTCVVSPELL